MHFRRSNLLRFLLEGFADLTSGVIYAMRLNSFVMNRRSVWTSMRSLAYLERKSVVRIEIQRIAAEGETSIRLNTFSAKKNRIIAGE